MSVDWESCPRLVAGVQTNEVADGYVVYDAPDRGSAPLGIGLR